MPPIAMDMFAGPAAMLEYRLQLIPQDALSTTNMVSIALLFLMVAAIVYYTLKSKRERERQKRKGAMATAHSLLFKRGGNEDDWAKMEYLLNRRPDIDPETVVMVNSSFKEHLFPLLIWTYGEEFAERLERLYYPPPKDSRVIRKGDNIRRLVDDAKTEPSSQNSGAILDLMDALLRPGLLMNLTFSGVEGMHNCLVMNSDSAGVNATLPANTPHLLALLAPGLSLDGSFESGPSLMAFTAVVDHVVTGEMPFFRMSVWKSAWEVRKREAIRLRVSIPLMFQHVSSKSSDMIKLSQLEQRMADKTAGSMLDIGLGGCCIAPERNAADYQIGDFIRFQAVLAAGQPPATLLGSVVHTSVPGPDLASLAGDLDPGIMLLHIQFLALDDVSQRLLARAVRQLQEAGRLDDWMRAQSMLQKVKRMAVQEKDRDDSSEVADSERGVR